MHSDIVLHVVTRFSPSLPLVLCFHIGEESRPNHVSQREVLLLLLCFSPCGVSCFCFRSSPSWRLRRRDGFEAENTGSPLAKSSGELGKGVSSMLSTVLRDFDFRSQQTLMSQNHLFSAIDRLIGGRRVAMKRSFPWDDRLDVSVSEMQLRYLLLDLPGIFEGAKDGKGRGRQVHLELSSCNL